MTICALCGAPTKRFSRDSPRHTHVGVTNALRDHYPLPVMVSDNQACPRCRRGMIFQGFATYYDGRYEIWECDDGTQLGVKEVVVS